MLLESIGTYDEIKDFLIIREKIMIQIMQEIKSRELDIELIQTKVNTAALKDEKDFNINHPNLIKLLRDIKAGKFKKEAEKKSISQNELLDLEEKSMATENSKIKSQVSTAARSAGQGAINVAKVPVKLAKATGETTVNAARSAGQGAINVAKAPVNAARYAGKGAVNVAKATGETTGNVLKATAEAPVKLAKATGKTTVNAARSASKGAAKVTAPLKLAKATSRMLTPNRILNRG